MGSTANSGADKRKFGQTVVSDTHVANPCFYLVVGSDPEIQDTSKNMFCVNLSSTAPSVRWTESAARHFSAASSLNRRLFLVTAFLRY